MSPAHAFAIGGVPLEVIASEHPKLLHELRTFDPLQVAAAFATLLTVPDLQSNVYGSKRWSNLVWRSASAPANHNRNTYATNVISETMRKTPNPAVIAWLVRNDAELALPTATIAEIAFGIGEIRPDQRAARLERGLASWRHRLPTGSSPSPKPRHSPTATS